MESLRSDAVSQLPKDGTVHELTSNVLMFLEQLLEYTDTIGKILIQDPTYSTQLDKLKATDKNKALLGLYISKHGLNSWCFLLIFVLSRESFESVKSYFGE